MNTQHYFLSSGSKAPSGRWIEAFPAGQVVTVAGLQGATAAMAATDFMVWVPSDDPEIKSLIGSVRALQPQARVVVVSGAPEPQEGLFAINAGAMGYTHAYALPEVLTEVATVVQHGGIWAGPDLLKALVTSTSAALARLPTNPQGESVTAKNNAKAWATLSGREAQVACQVALGHSNKEVADSLFIAERTVKAHLGAVFEKLAVRDRLQLAVFVATIPADLRGAKGGEA